MDLGDGMGMGFDVYVDVLRVTFIVVLWYCLGNWVFIALIDAYNGCYVYIYTHTYIYTYIRIYTTFLTHK